MYSEGTDRADMAFAEAKQQVFHRDVLTRLREEAKWSVSHNPQVEPLKSFALVGCPNFDINARYSDDATRFIQLFRYLIRSGIPIDTNFTIDAIDIQNNRNYLHENKKADVTLISYVPLYDATSEDEHAWTERLEQSGSKIIFSVCEGLELNLARMAPSNYVPLGTAEEWDRRDPTRCHDMFKFRSNIPYNPSADKLVEATFKDTGRWQVVGEKGFIEQTAQFLGGKTQLVRASYEQASKLLRENQLRRVALVPEVPAIRHES
jgi:hypothetical protein